jgi:uncharacterized membrane protein HdeD (DUF308 family)
MTNLEYIQINAEIEREKSKEKMWLFRRGILMIIIGGILLILKIKFLVVLVLISGIMFIVGSCFNSWHLKARTKKLNDLYKKNVEAEEAIEEILKN